MGQQDNDQNRESKGSKETSVDFIRAIVAEDISTNKWDGKVITRFPPEPNGFLHIGHAKSICLNFGIAAENKDARCHLRFDDTNPVTEEDRYVNSIQDDVRWLGWDWNENLYYASDYFEQMYDYAVQLIEKGHAYVCDLNASQISEYRGTLTSPGKDSPHRNRSVEENVDLFSRNERGRI